MVNVFRGITIKSILYSPNLIGYRHRLISFIIDYIFSMILYFFGIKQIISGVKIHNFGVCGPTFTLNILYSMTRIRYVLQDRLVAAG